MKIVHLIVAATSALFGLFAAPVVPTAKADYVAYCTKSNGYCPEWIMPKIQHLRFHEERHWYTKYRVWNGPQWQHCPSGTVGGVCELTYTQGEQKSYAVGTTMQGDVKIGDVLGLTINRSWTTTTTSHWQTSNSIKVRKGEDWRPFIWTGGWRYTGWPKGADHRENCWYTKFGSKQCNYSWKPEQPWWDKWTMLDLHNKDDVHVTWEKYPANTKDYNPISR